MQVGNLAAQDAAYILPPRPKARRRLLRDSRPGLGGRDRAMTRRPEWHEQAAAVQEKHAAAQEAHARHARVLGEFEMAARADGRALLARARARNELERAAKAASRYR